MNPAERENMIGILCWVTMWNRSALDSLSDEELEKLYEERCDRG
ncbi:MAG: BH0509 family protein [Bacillota bacterium]